MIPYGHQDIDDSDIESVGKALRGEFLTTGPLVEKFENELEHFTGAATTVVSSGTAALHCAYKAIDIQAGDEVITPTYFCSYTSYSHTIWCKNCIFRYSRRYR